MADRDYWVTVCASCLTAACWHGEFFCGRARTAKTTLRRASDLRKLGLENPGHYSREKIEAVTGNQPREVTGG